MDSGVTGATVTTIPSYIQIKDKIINQLSIAESVVSEYLVKGSSNKRIVAIKALTKLMIALSDYLYVVDDSKEKDLFCAYLATPELFISMSNLAAVLTIAKKIVYSLGISQIEILKVSPWDAFRQVE